MLQSGSLTYPSISVVFVISFNRLWDSDASVTLSGFLGLW